MTTLDLIQLRFPNRLRLSLGEACQMLGISPATARNSICKKTFKIPTIKDQHRTYIIVQDLADFIDGLTATENK